MNEPTATEQTTAGRRRLRRALTCVFFVMSPFFPGNNWLEVSLIGMVARRLASVLAPGTDIGLIRVALYVVYNAIGIAGYFLCRTPADAATAPHRSILDLALGLLLLLATRYIPAPWDTYLLAAAGLFFLRTHLAHALRYVENPARRRSSMVRRPPSSRVSR